MLTNKTKLKPYWTSDCGRATVYVGDCRKVLPELEQEQFHAVVTDPPYGLEFMGKEWDAPWKSNGGVDAKDRRTSEMDDPTKAKYLRHNVEYVRDSHLFQQWFMECATVVMGVAKPGAHMLSFGGTRMYHRMVCAVEDAGWECRDMIGWVYATGFPKSHDISKAIDKIHGADRVAVRQGVSKLGKGQFTRNTGVDNGYGYGDDYNVTAPATDDAKRWSGWGTALKPAFEPIVVARKPLDGNIAQNTLEHGCGGLNIDACRVGTEQRVNTPRGTESDGWGFKAGATVGQSVTGRWPANIIHDGSDEVVNLFPQSTSKVTEVTSKPGKVYGGGDGLPSHTGVYGFDDSGSVARIFYCAKANDEDRPHNSSDTVHPTVKPLDLMQYLVRLVCPRGGVVLDPFMGSGSTGCAALAEGMSFVGIEQDEKYADIAVGRLKLALQSAPPLVTLKTREPIITKDSSPHVPKKLRLK